MVTRNLGREEAGRRRVPIGRKRVRRGNWSCSEEDEAPTRVQEFKEETVMVEEAEIETAMVKSNVSEQQNGLDNQKNKKLFVWNSTEKLINNIPRKRIGLDLCANNVLLSLSHSLYLFSFFAFLYYLNLNLIN